MMATVLICSTQSWEDAHHGRLQTMSCTAFWLSSAIDAFSFHRLGGKCMSILRTCLSRLTLSRVTFELSVFVYRYVR